MTRSIKLQEILFWGFFAICVGTSIWLASRFLFVEERNVEVLRFAHVYEVSHPLHKGALNVAQEVEVATDGRIKIQVYPASSLGKEVAINEALTLGVVDIIYTGTGFAGATYGPISMSDFPYTLRNINHWRAYIQSDLFKELSEEYRKASNGNEIASVGYFGSRHTIADRPLLLPEDMENLKIRIPNAPAYVMFPKAVGANPAPIAFSEAYLALQQGVVDGLENPLPILHANRFYEVRKHISLTNHIINSTLTVVSGDRFSKLQDKDEEIVRTALVRNANWATNQVLEAEQTLIEWFENEGLTVHTVDIDAFQKAVMPALTAEGVPFSPETLARLQDIPDAISVESTHE